MRTRARLEKTPRARNTRLIRTTSYNRQQHHHRNERVSSSVSRRLCCEWKLLWSERRWTGREHRARKKKSGEDFMPFGSQLAAIVYISVLIQFLFFSFHRTPHKQSNVRTCGRINAISFRHKSGQKSKKCWNNVDFFSSSREYKWWWVRRLRWRNLLPLSSRSAGGDWKVQSLTINNEIMEAKRLKVQIKFKPFVEDVFVIFCLPFRMIFVYRLRYALWNGIVLTDLIGYVPASTTTVRGWK